MKPLYVKKNGVVYKISGTGIPSIYPAANVEYDNTVTSELQATDVQGAIDELSTRQGGVQSDWNEDDSTELDYIKNKPQNLVQDASYVHTDNNYDATAKGKVDSLGTASTKNVGVANGVAELDAAGKVPSSQLPSFVDDVIEVADYDHLPITGESGKIYVTLDTNKTYRWTGSGYAEISESLALGETSSTAYRGDRGKVAYDHATETKLSTATASGLYKVASTAQGHIASLTAVTKEDITGLGIPAQDTNNKVTQTASNTNATYEVLFSGTNDNTTRTEGAKKNSNLTFNPFTGLLLLNYFGTSPDITSRLTSLNFAPNTVAPGTGRTAMRLDLATSAVTEGKPLSSVAGYIHTYYWDGGAAMTQIYIPNGDHVWTRNGPQGIMIRGYDETDAEWKDWEYIPFMSEAPTSGQVLVADGTSGKIKTSGYTIAKSVPSNAVFTDTNTKVTQNNLGNTNTGTRRVILSGSANDTTETAEVYKNTQLQFTPSTGFLSSPKIKATINNSVLTGTGTAAQDKGASANPRYFPAKWQFNTGYNPSEGDIITITLPVAGHDWGDWISINNGSTWHPANFQGATRLTTHFSAGQVVQFVFDADGSTASMTPVDGANSVNGSTITGGCWRVVNMYDSNSNTIPSAYCGTAAATAAKAASCSAYALLDKSYIHVLIRYANTSASAITMNINGTGAKAIYINGAASSASNYTLPAGTYLVYYASNIFYFRTDGIIQNQVPVRSNGYGYTPALSAYWGESGGKYFRITIPKKGQTWTMLFLEMSLRIYSSQQHGKILLRAQWSSTDEWNNFKAVLVGDLTNNANLQVYGSDKNYIYVYCNYTYVTLSVDKMLIGDNATSFDLSEISLDTVSALPTTYQTATMALTKAGDAATVNGLTVQTAVPSGAKFTDTIIKNTAYGTCDTAGDVKDKVATLSNATNWVLEVGTIVGVRFTYTNTYARQGSNKVTLNVNNTGAKEIHYSNDIWIGGVDIKCPTAFGEAGQTIYYMYDGTYWVWVSHSKDSDTTYAFDGNEFRSEDGNNYYHGGSTNGNANNMTVNGHYYYKSNGPSTAIGASGNDGAMFVQAYDSDNVAQIAQNYENGNIFVRSKVNGSWTEWKKTEAIDKEIRDKADNTTTSISGNPISISGLKSNQLAVNPIITLEPIQAGSGTPSPSNIRAISGYDKVEVLSCGKNLFDGTYSVTGKYLMADGSEYAGTYNISQYISVKANTAYYFSNLSGTTSACICWYNKAKEFISSQSITAGFTSTSPANACYVRASVHNTRTDVCINEGNTAVTYVPYVKATDFSESLGQTSFGGELDVRQGDYADGYFEVDLGDLNWSYRTEASVSGKNVFSSTNMTAYKNGGEVNAVCSGYNYAGLVGGLADMANKNNFDICVLATNGSNYVIYLRDSRYTDASQLKTALSGVKLVIERLSANHIQLTPHEISLLKDYAYVSTNGTNIQFDYHNGELASLADVAQVGETLNALGTKLNYRDYTVKGDGTTTWGNLLSSLKPIYESLSEDEKTYSKLIFRPESISGNECLSYCGAYWYSRIGLNGITKTLWIDHASLGPSSSYIYYYQKNGDTFIDKTSETTTYSLSLRVFVEVGNNS